MIDFYFVWVTDDNFISNASFKANSLKDAIEYFLKCQVDRLSPHSPQITYAYVVLNCQLIDIMDYVRWRHANKICMLAEKLYKKTLRGEDTSSEEKDMFDYLNGRRERYI
jgi:hypothetical protein